MAKSGVGTRIVDGDLADNRSGHHPTFASRHLDSDRLAIATHNPGKLAEMHELLAPYGIAAISADELGLVEPDESGVTFGENARIKAEAVLESFDGRFYTLCVTARDEAQEIGRGTVGRAVVSRGRFPETIKMKNGSR